MEDHRLHAGRPPATVSPLGDRPPIASAQPTLLPAVRLAQLWSTNGAPEPLALPTALAVSRRGRVVVVDAGNDRVCVFDRDGQPVAWWGQRGGDDGQFRFRRPDRCDDLGDCQPDAGGAVTFDTQERLYVADYGNSRVQVFDRDGRLLTRWGREGWEPGELQRPEGIAVDGRGQVYVSDTENHRIQVFDEGGRFLRQWGRKGTAAGALCWPGALAIDEQSQVHVTDQGNRRVQVFAPDGRPLRQWQAVDSIDGAIQRPVGLAVDRWGKVYAGGAWGHSGSVYTGGEVGRLFRYSPAGQLAATWDGFRQPTGLAVDEAGDLYVADRRAACVTKFRVLDPTTH